MVAYGLIGGGDVWAQGKDAGAPPTGGDASAVAPPVSEARKLYDEGDAFAQKDNWEEARSKFQKAHELEPSEPKYMAALIKAEMATGRNREAANHLVILLRPAAPLPKSVEQKAQEMLASLRKEKLGVAKITVNIDGAEVFVDDVALGTSPVGGDVFVDAGPRTFRAKKSGYVTAEVPMNVAAGSEPKVALELKKAKEPVGPKDEGDPNKTLIYVGAGVAGALAVVGVGTAIGAADAESKSHDDWTAGNCNVTRAPSCYSNFDEQENKRFQLGNTSFWMFMSAVAVGGGTAVYALLPRKSKDEASAGSVWVAPTLGGAVVSGTF